MYLQSVFRHCILERYVFKSVFQTENFKKQRGTEWHDNYIRVMRKERGPNTRISFPTHKREKGHNNQGRKYLL